MNKTISRFKYTTTYGNRTVHIIATNKSESSLKLTEFITEISKFSTLWNNQLALISKTKLGTMKIT